MLTADPKLCILTAGAGAKGELMKPKILDVSMIIKQGMLSWPSDGPVKVERVRSMDAGERLNQSRLEMSSHTGTHIDAPIHFVRGGGGVDSLPLDILMGPALVVHIPHERSIGRKHLQEADIPQETERLLLKTDNSELLGESEFSRDFSFLSPDGAEYLTDRGIRLVGIDYLSIAQYGHGETVHFHLLSREIIVVEGLDLRGVPAGNYRMTALPLKILGCDGAPARVVLEED